MGALGQITLSHSSTRCSSHRATSYAPITALRPKPLEFLHGLLSAIGSVALLVNPSNLNSRRGLRRWVRTMNIAPRRRLIQFAVLLVVPAGGAWSSTDLLGRPTLWGSTTVGSCSRARHPMSRSSVGRQRASRMSRSRTAARAGLSNVLRSNNNSRLACAAY